MINILILIIVIYLLYFVFALKNNLIKPNTLAWKLEEFIFGKRSERTLELLEKFSKDNNQSANK